MKDAHAKLLAAGLAWLSSLLPVRAADPPCNVDCAPCIAWYAIPSRTCRTTGGYIGGGCLRHGSKRPATEGTWGYDYVLFRRHPERIFLNWCNCRPGPRLSPYQTDGRHVPDVIATHPAPDCNR